MSDWCWSRKPRYRWWLASVWMRAMSSRTSRISQTWPSTPSSRVSLLSMRRLSLTSLYPTVLLASCLLCIAFLTNTSRVSVSLTMLSRHSNRSLIVLNTIRCLEISRRREMLLLYRHAAFSSARSFVLLGIIPSTRPSATASSHGTTSSPLLPSAAGTVRRPLLRRDHLRTFHRRIGSSAWLWASSCSRLSTGELVSRAV
mmetsp:Transcript_25450/g.60397  ORF Transcript_25450/g.60397 Transcript_25450/m.60397 type:complete len:200 (-) Transcript_25450:139-738(-)